MGLAAAFNGCVDAVSALLAAGADAEMVSDDGETAVALAASTAHQLRQTAINTGREPDAERLGGLVATVAVLRRAAAAGSAMAAAGVEVDGILWEALDCGLRCCESTWRRWRCWQRRQQFCSIFVATLVVASSLSRPPRPPRPPSHPIGRGPHAASASRAASPYSCHFCRSSRSSFESRSRVMSRASSIRVR